MWVVITAFVLVNAPPLKGISISVYISSPCPLANMTDGTLLAVKSVGELFQRSSAVLHCSAGRGGERLSYITNYT